MAYSAWSVIWELPLFIAVVLAKHCVRDVRGARTPDVRGLCVFFRFFVLRRRPTHGHLEARLIGTCFKQKRVAGGQVRTVRRWHTPNSGSETMQVSFPSHGPSTAVTPDLAKSRTAASGRWLSGSKSFHLMNNEIPVINKSAKNRANRYCFYLRQLAWKSEDRLARRPFSIVENSVPSGLIAKTEDLCDSRINIIIARAFTISLFGVITFP